jgi:hypothetical protein
METSLGYHPRVRRGFAIILLLTVSLAVSLAAADVLMDVVENRHRAPFYTNLTPAELAKLPVRTSGTITGAYIDEITVLPWHEPHKRWIWAGQRQGSIEFLVKGRWNNIGCHDNVDYAASSQRAVLFLGDSFVEAMQVDVRDTFYDRLRHLKFGDRFDVWACGLAGGHPSRLAEHMRGSKAQQPVALGQLSALRPAYVVYMVYMGNDLRDFAGPIFEDTQAAAPPCRPRIEPGRSFLWFRMRQVVDMYLSSGGAEPLCLNTSFWPYVAAHIPAVEEGWHGALKGLDELNAMVTERGGKLAIALIEPFPVAYGEFAMERAVRANYPGGKRVPLDLSQPRRRLLEYAANRKLTFIDLSDALRECGGENDYYPSDSHFNVAGHRCVAAYLDKNQTAWFP